MSNNSEYQISGNLSLEEAKQISSILLPSSSDMIHRHDRYLTNTGRAEVSTDSEVSIEADFSRKSRLKVTHSMQTKGEGRARIGTTNECMILLVVAVALVLSGARTCYLGSVSVQREAIALGIIVLVGAVVMLGCAFALWMKGR